MWALFELLKVRELNRVYSPLCSQSHIKLNLQPPNLMFPNTYKLCTFWQYSNHPLYDLHTVNHTEHSLCKVNLVSCFFRIISFVWVWQFHRYVNGKVHLSSEDEAIAIFEYFLQYLQYFYCLSYILDNCQINRQTFNTVTMKE